jgi:hypothetical protein
LLKLFIGYDAPKNSMNHSHSTELDATYNSLPAKPFDQLPRYVQLALIERSGLSEAAFHKQRQERRKKELLASKGKT